MHAGSLTSVAPSNAFGEFLAVLTGVDRPLREPGIEHLAAGAAGPDLRHG